MIMKKIFRTLMLLPAVAMALTGCVKEAITFDHEQPAFDTRDGQILIEAILPTATAYDDDIYIAGPFAGDSAAVVGNGTYKLIHSDAISAKWGIYLDPASFKDGKTLADGFFFVNVQQGIERSVKNEDILHYLDAEPGKSYNVYADRWRAFFESSADEGFSLPEHDGVRVYIIDNTGWEAIALYQWGDVNDFGGGWPGSQVAGTETMKGVTYKYFEYGDDIYGLSQNLIFNNGGNGVQLPDYALTFEAGVQDYFFEVTPEEVKPISAPAADVVLPEHDGVRVYANDQTGWDDIALYQWGDVNDFGGGWPGAQVAGTEMLAGVSYKYFEYGSDIVGLNQNLIFNNNGNGVQLADFALTFEEGVADYFFKVTADGAVLLSGPDDTGITPPEPEPEAEDGPKVYVQNKTTWGGSLFAHYWGPSETSWPGYEMTETVTVGDAEYLVLPTLHGDMGETVGIIFHAEDDALRVETSITLNTDRYYTLTDEGLTEDEIGIRLFVKNESRWPGKLFAHIWYGEGESLVATEWPGVESVPGYAKGDVYDVILVPAIFKGQEVNIIFHDDADADNNRFQTSLPIGEDMYYNLKIDYYLEEQEKAPVTIYVNDQTAWEGITLYIWGDINNLGGGWPGINVNRTEDICGTMFKVFEIPNAMTRNENLIFNNGGQGLQLPDHNITFDKDEYYFIVTAEGITEIERPVPSRVTFFVNDKTTWDAITIYQWGQVNDLGGGWPGAQVGGTVTVGETAYKVFTAEQAAGLSQHLIFNNNNGGAQLSDFDLTFDKSEYFFTVTDEGVTLEDAPKSVVLFVEDLIGWDAITLYQWGEVDNLGGGWPGAQVQTTVSVNGKDYKVFVIDDAIGYSQNLIFSNNGANQLGDFALTFEKNSYYFKVSAEGVELN